MFPAHRVIIANVISMGRKHERAPPLPHTLMLTESKMAQFKSLHALGEQLNVSGRAGKSGYHSILLITLWDGRTKHARL